MDKLAEVLKSAVNDGNVFEKLQQATGTYEDKVTDAKDVEAKTAYASLPKAPETAPFSVSNK